MKNLEKIEVIRPETKAGDTIDEIVVILLTQLLSTERLVYNGFKTLKEKVAQYVYLGLPIKVVLPAFPCKSVSDDKCLGKEPDMGEWLALKTIVSAVRNIEELYKPGVIVTIFSDYHTFSDYISVDLEDHYRYREGLNKLIDKFLCNDIIQIKSLCDYGEFLHKEEKDYMETLREMYGDREFENVLSERIANDNTTNSQYTAIKKFMEDDQRQLAKNLGKNDKRRRISEVARGMMIQGKALDKFINTKFPDCIRLSIHDYPLDGKKNTVQFYQAECFKTPWHNCVLFDAQTGKFVVGKKKDVIANAHKRGAIVVSVRYEEKDWMLLQLSPKSLETTNKLGDLKACLYRPDCGLLIENTNAGAGLDISEIDNIEITNLIKHFGVVVFRGFGGFDQTQDLETWYSTRGEMLRWKFGPTHHVRPEIDDEDTPKSSVTSEEALPIHWDMVSPPPYMEIDQKAFGYKDYIPREFVLYCKSNKSKGMGLSTLVNSAMVPLMMSGRERRAMKNTTLAYRTTMSYFGGVERSYPLIMNCPWTAQSVIRWWEMWDEGSKPPSIQYNYSRIASSDYFTDMHALEKRLIQLCTNERCYFSHEFQEGDISLVNNYTILHGRTAFQGERELWRVQLQPPSLNSPWKKTKDY